MESVLNQDYPNLEYIVVDGNSTDGSQEIIETYTERLAWWVSEPDQGQADAINKGFRRAKGEIIAWLNSDDMYLPWTIPDVVDCFNAHPQAGLIYGDAVSCDQDGRLLNELRFDTWDLKDLLQFNIICQPAVFMKRNVVEKIGYLDPSYHFFLDHQLWIRIAQESQLIHQPRIWAVSRYHPEAKNVTMASVVGKEVYRILGWAVTEQDLAMIIRNNYRKTWSGANKIIARYLLDGGMPKKAFKMYLNSAKQWPPSIKDYWHRWLFSALNVLGFGILSKYYYNLKSTRSPQIFREKDLENWYGIQFEDTSSD
jgi:glycosyltransferase involved in cell wall biosynthesis